MSGQSLKQKTIGGVFWSAFGLIARQGTSFIVSLILCRLLEVADFGVVGLCVGLIGISQALTDAGLVSAMIRQKQPSLLQWSTSFWLNVILALILTGVLFLSATWLGEFFEDERIGEVLQWLAPLILVHAMSSTQQTMLRKEMKFKPIAIASLMGALVSAPVAITMAYSGHGIWALVVQAYLSSITRGLILWFNSAWRPRLIFDIYSLSPLWSYIKKVFFADMLGIVFARLDVLIIGRMFNLDSLGYYNRAKSFNLLINRYSAESLRAVLFSTLASIADQKERVKQVYHNLLHVVGYLAIGLSGLFYITAVDLVPLLFSDKWIPATPYLKVMLLAGYAAPLTSLQINILRGVGNGSAFLQGDVIKKVLLLGSFLIGFQYGIMGFLWARAIISVMEVLLINGYFVKKDVGSKIRGQLWSILQYGLIAVGIILMWEILIIGQVPEGRFLRVLLSGVYFGITYLMVNAILPSLGQRAVVKEVREIFMKMRRV